MRDQRRPRVTFFQATELNVMKKTQQSLIPSRLIPAFFFFFFVQHWIKEHLAPLSAE